MIARREVREITDRGEWLRWRETDITASRVAALFDCHPYLKRDQLVEIMRGGGAGSSTPPDNAAMRRGRIFEAAVISALEEERPHWLVTKATTYHRLPDRRLGCTPDVFVTSSEPAEAGQGLIQIKTVNPFEFNRWRGRPPLHYILQTLTELLVTDAEWGHLAVMVTTPSYPVHCFPIMRHPAAEARLLGAVEQWWNDWDAGRIAPPASVEGLAEMFDDGSTIDLSANNRLPELLEERATLKAQVRVDELRLKEIDTDLKAAIGAAKVAWLPGWQMTYATQHRAEKLMPAADIRVLRVSRLRDDDQPTGDDLNQ